MAWPESLKEGATYSAGALGSCCESVRIERSVGNHFSKLFTMFF